MTLGAGYDFKFRLREQIVEDLTRLGVDPATARKLSVAGATKGGKGQPVRLGLSGPAAEKFVNDHAEDLDLNEEKQRLLLVFSIAEYEKDVRRRVKIKLSQDEFDALVLFDLSRGRGSLEKVAKLLNSGQRAEAISRLRHFDDSLGAGFTSRRQAEADMMLRPHQLGAGTTGSVP